MSTHFADIAGALRTRLSTLSSLPDVAWENTNYRPTGKAIYLRPTHLPGETIQASLGDNGKDEHNGLFQVDVFVPDGQGRTTWPDAIADHFKRGTTLDQNGVEVRIRNASLGPSGSVENYFIVPVTINYQAFTEARS